MNKKFKKVLVVVSAIAMSTMSLSSVSSHAGYLYNYSCNNGLIRYYDGDIGVICRIPLDTVSFTVGEEKCTLWQEAMDYFYDVYGDRVRIYRTEPNESGNRGIYSQLCEIGTTEEGQIYHEWSLYRNSYISYSNLNKEEEDILVKFLSENNIRYEYVDVMLDEPVLSFPDVENVDDFFSLATIVKENTGLTCCMAFPESMVVVDKVEVPLPKPTLSGDVNEDGEVKLSDAVLVMQALSNPNEYQLTPQGIANADMDGNGITPIDALRIQEIALDK